MAGGTDIPLAAFGFEIDELFSYQYNLCVPWEIDCRVDARGLISLTQPVDCLSAIRYKRSGSMAPTTKR